MIPLENFIGMTLAINNLMIMKIMKMMKMMKMKMNTNMNMMNTKVTTLMMILMKVIIVKEVMNCDVSPVAMFFANLP